MTRKDKIEKRKERSLLRAQKNIERNKDRWKRNGRNYGLDCPYDVDINGIYGSCNCGHENYDSCLGDI